VTSGHVKATKAPEGATTGAATGGATGGVIGLLAGIGALAIPGVGPFIAAGPIMAALSGAAVGAATGGVVGGLIGLGIPEIEAKRYDEKLKKGNYLIAVHTDESEDVDRAKQIFKTAGAEDISTVREASAPKALTNDEEGKSMADENQMDQGPAVPPQAKEEAKRGVTHARKAAEDLRSAAGAMADEYRARGKEVWDDALHRVRKFSGRQQAIRPREPDEGGFYCAGESVSCSV
jgi:hypothetical protein